MTQAPSLPEDLDRWSSVDRYFERLLLPADEALEAALNASRAAGLPAIQVSPVQGKFLHLVAAAIQARRVLEIGTLGGYSTIWLASSLPTDGRLVTLELEAKHADVARANLRRAGLDHLVDIRIGPALEGLARLRKEQVPPFDLVFIDADKPNSPAYLDGAVSLSRKGTVILVDNVGRRGDVADASSTDASVRGVREMIQQMGADPRLRATAIQTVGAKGHDGFAMALVVR